MTIRSIICGLCIESLLRVCATAQDYENPLQGSIATHDPCIIKHIDTYHVYFTGNLIRHVTSKDRTNWTLAGSTITGPAWIKTAVPKNNGTDFWAPDISFRAAKFWMYYAVSTFGSNTSAIGLATSASLSSPEWTDQGIVIKSTSQDDYNCIDPNAFQDTNGKTWLVFGSFWSGIYLAELDALTGKPAASPPVLTNLAAHSGGIEAPFLYKRGSYYYLFVSWDKCCNGASSTYNIRFGRSASITGPYLDTSGTSMKSGGGTLLWAGDGRWKGPGAQNVFADHDSTFLVCHSYDANAQGAVTLIIRPLYWTDKDWPSLIATRNVNPVAVVNGNGKTMRSEQPAMKKVVIFDRGSVFDKGMFKEPRFNCLYTACGERLPVTSGEASFEAGVYFLYQSSIKR